ncbi:Oidioi.mRNA.OKI2018_I69.chr1.g298.t1.cds [Oikopleura dioica]|uniref:Oidioi.mRNA.OKI2018_I69.chr1.g298.t1.cds n=1 Tax=Oikopleura dioica TaxID=34765 RepID=A0ABN7SRL3_OIKDI|nr:Oidioi.mRNA.OKI2018_I69.chr1.g298.t1.cds [Oikopleura dioica]
MSSVFTANNIVAANVRRKDILYAVEGGDVSWLELSLAHQNNSTVIGSNGETALHRAAKKANYQVIQKLLDHGFSPLAVDNNGRNALFWFAENAPLRRKLTKASKETISKLTKPHFSSDKRHIQGINFDLQDQDGYTVMHVAAKNGNWPLCEHFSSLDRTLFLVKDNNGNTPEDIAVLFNRRECSKQLKHATAEYVRERKTEEYRKLQLFKKKFCDLQNEALSDLLNSRSDRSREAFVDFTSSLKGSSANPSAKSLPREELLHGLRSRLRIAGKVDACENGEFESKEATEGLTVVTPQKPRERKLTEDFQAPLPPSSGLPVQLARTKAGRPLILAKSAKVRGPELPMDTVKTKLGDGLPFRPLNNGSHWQPRHVDDNSKRQHSEEKYETTVQFHLKR